MYDLEKVTQNRLRALKGQTLLPIKKGELQLNDISIEYIDKVLYQAGIVDENGKDIKRVKG